jgi:hypothetical protein
MITVLQCNKCKGSHTEPSFNYIPRIRRKIKTYKKCYCFDCKEVTSSTLVDYKNTIEYKPVLT